MTSLVSISIILCAYQSRELRYSLPWLKKSLLIFLPLLLLILSLSLNVLRIGCNGIIEPRVIHRCCRCCRSELEDQIYKRILQSNVEAIKNYNLPSSSYIHSLKIFEAYFASLFENLDTRDQNDVEGGWTNEIGSLFLANPGKGKSSLQDVWLELITSPMLLYIVSEHVINMMINGTTLGMITYRSLFYQVYSLLSRYWSKLIQRG